MDHDCTPLDPHSYLFSSSLNGDALRNDVVQRFGLDLLEPQLFPTWDHNDTRGRMVQLWSGKDEHALFQNQIAVEIVVEEGTCYTGKRMLLYNPEGSENTFYAILLDAGYGFDSTATAVSKDNYTNPGFVFTDRVADIVCWRLIEKAHQSDPNDMLNSRFGRLMYALGDQKYQQPEGAVLDDNNDGVEAEGSDGADGARTPPTRAPLALGVKPPPGAGRHGGAHYAETTEPAQVLPAPGEDGRPHQLHVAGRSRGRPRHGCGLAQWRRCPPPHQGAARGQEPAGARPTRPRAGGLERDGCHHERGGGHGLALGRRGRARDRDGRPTPHHERRGHGHGLVLGRRRLGGDRRRRGAGGARQAHGHRAPGHQSGAGGAPRARGQDH
eukprot:scaffold34378_cov65-Phaeocystis_antarctica.AAC.3